MLNLASYILSRWTQYVLLYAVILMLFIQAAMMNPQVTLDSQLHRDYYTILHLPFFGSVNKSPTQRLTMN